MKGNTTLDLLTRLAHGVARQFGNNCEVVIHDLTGEDNESTVVVIENGHVTDRKIGDPPSHVVLEALKKDPDTIEDHLDYLTKTHDGKILKSSTIYIRDDDNTIIGVFAINYDITGLMMVESSIQSLIGNNQSEEAENIPTNVGELLNDLIEQSVKKVGKPAALMTKNEKMRAIEFLNNAGALLITKSSDKIANYFGISKYTLYSYIDQINQNNQEKK
ncbi:MAG: helix-turn-helix transcriptional regulator [Eubacterium sp.]